MTTDTDFNLFSVEADRIMMRLSGDVYPLDVVYRSLYTYIDAAYFRLDMESGTTKEFVVTLLPREGTDMESLRRLAGEILNELMSQALRKAAHKANKKTLGYIVARSLLSAKHRMDQIQGPILGVSDTGQPSAHCRTADISAWRIRRDRINWGNWRAWWRIRLSTILMRSWRHGKRSRRRVRILEGVRGQCDKRKMYAEGQSGQAER